MDNVSQNKSVLNIPPILVVILFFFPWLTLSCGGQAVGQFSGFQLASGNLGINQTNSAYQYNGNVNNYNGDAKLFVIPLAGVVALVALNVSQTFQKRWYMGIGVIGILLQIYYYLDLQGQVRNAANQGAVVIITYEIGWWLTVLAFVAIIFLGWQYKPNATANSPSPKT
jgi:hypothetical protein